MKIKLNLTPWLFLAPALIYFTIMVIYPIIGSVHISFHDWNGTQFKCSDGRDIKSLQETKIKNKSINENKKDDLDYQEERLLKLKDMFEKGLISEKEYKKLRQKTLGL